MSGKGELVEYTRIFKKKPLSAADKADLKNKINKLIDDATESITVVVLVEAGTDD